MAAPLTAFGASEVDDDDDLGGLPWGAVQRETVGIPHRNPTDPPPQFVVEGDIWPVPSAPGELNIPLHMYDDELPPEEAGLTSPFSFDASLSASERPSPMSSSSEAQRLVWSDDFFSEEASTEGSDSGTARLATIDLGALAAANAFALPLTTPTNNANHAGLVVAAAASLQSYDCTDVRAQRSTRKRGMGHDSSTEKTTAALGDQTGHRCPICLSAVQGSVCQSVQSRFAKYVRTTTRRDNNLAEFYRKWGYRGPKYCKSCAESFNSHLLKTAQRSSRVTCTREIPCDRCTLILDHFNTPKEQVFAAVDASKREKCARKRQKQKHRQHEQRHEHKDLTPTSPAPSVLPVPQPTSRDSDRLSSWMHVQQRSPVSRKLLALTGAVAVVMLSALQWNDPNSGGVSTQPSSDNDANADVLVPEWACGAAAAALFHATVPPHNLTSICHGVSRESTFPCDIDDCDAGQLAIGQRKCRCDGCFQKGGRCAGWVLEGYGPAPVETGCGVNPSFQSDPEPYDWRPPGVAAKDCSVTCGYTEGCIAHVETQNDESQCTLRFPRLWPQSLVYDRRKDRSAAAHNAEIVSGQRMGMIWSKDSRSDGKHDTHDIWHWTIDDGGEILGPTFINLANEMGNQSSADPHSATSDLHLMWKFNSGNRTWQALSSSLNRRPSPRVGAGYWVDMGSLFLVGGLSLLPQFTVGGVVPFSVVDNVPRSMYDQNNRTLHESNAVVDLWEYDTAATEWRPLHTLMTQRPTTGQSKVPTTWPGMRYGSSVWRDRGEARETSMSGESNAKKLGGANSEADSDGRHTKIWMFAGWSSKSSGGRAATELWQYVYIHDRHLTKESMLQGLGEWKLVTAEAEASNPMQPLFTCKTRRITQGSHLDQSTAQKVTVTCPLPRRDAGSWPSPNSFQGGWIFGGITNAMTTSDLPAEQIRGLNDLWHWNGDVHHPAWEQTLPEMHSVPAHLKAAWPPTWQSPLGWASDASGGELWLVGDSGMVQEPDLRATSPTIQEVGSNILWRFSVAEGKWHRYQVQRANGAGLWPAAREFASVADGGWMYGGVAASDRPPFECLGSDGDLGLSGLPDIRHEYSPHQKMAWRPQGSSPFADEIPLSGMWRWRDSASTALYQ